MAMPSHRESVSSPKPTQAVIDSKPGYTKQQSSSEPSQYPAMIATSGTKATSNSTWTTRTTGKTGPTIMFPVLNMAEQDIIVKETSGTNQTIDILTKEKGLVAMTLSSDRSPLKYVAIAKSGNETLMISGHKEYTLDLKKLGKNGSFPGLYVHKDGQDWKALINGQDSNKKTFHFAATDISHEEVVTLEEPAITKLRFDVIKGSIIQSGISSFGISAPFQLTARSKNNEEMLLINGQQIFYANGSKDSSDIVNLVIHKKDQDWRSESSNGNLALTDSMISQFIIMNMLHKDITVEEASSSQFIDIQQSEMMQLARPLSNKRDGFKFSAVVKDTKKPVMINDQATFLIDMHDLSMMNILVVHDEGQNWQQIQSSLLQTGSGSAESTNEPKTSENEGSLSLQKSLEPAASKYSLQITAVNMQQNETVVLQEVTDDKENVDIPGNATATLGLLISGATKPLRFKAIVKSSKELLYVNGKKELLVDPRAAKGLESIIVIAEKGAAWEQTRSATLDLVGTENQGLVQVDETATYDFANEAKALQLKVVNKAACSIRIQEISSAGQRLDVPADATATLGFLIRARQEPLKFKAFEAKTGEELFLNGQRILPMDVDSNGYAAIIVVHKQGFNFETARNEEFQRTRSSGKITSTTSIPLQLGELGAGSSANNTPLPQFSNGILGHAANSGPANSIILNKISNLHEKDSHESSQNLVSGDGPSLPSAGQENKTSQVASMFKKTQLKAPFDESGTQKQELMPEMIDFVVVNGANGFAFLHEVSGSGQKLELPRKDSVASLRIKTKSRFLPLTFKATMKDSSQQLFVNGHEELDVASEALSPYWLVIHSKGENWEAIKARLQKSKGLKVDLSTPGITKIIGSSVPSQLRMIPIAFHNIVGKDVDLEEITGTLYKENAKTNSTGMFYLPVTPEDRTEPIKLRAIMRNTSEKVLMNGEEEYFIDVNSAFVVIIIHKSEQRWKLARKNFHYATLGVYAKNPGIGMGSFNSSALEPWMPKDAEKSITLNETEAVAGSGQSAMDTSRIAVWNLAGVEVELQLNSNQLKNFPVGAKGAISLIVTQGVTSILTAIDVKGAQLFLNNEKQLVISGENYPQSIIITAQNNSGHTNFMKDDTVGPSIKYGKVNFINLANREVKIFETSGIGEPTLLSPNFISTFFLKSPKDSATFRALDPITNEVYLMNEQPTLEVKLDTNPRIETEVQVTAPKDLRQTSTNKDVTCLAVTELGPCYSALQYETQVEAAEGKSETCKKYLEEVLSKCAQKNISHGIDSCKKHCNSKDSDVCERIWSPKVCSSSIVRYSFNPETRTCQVMNFNGCLGNLNNFATPEECAKSCILETASKKPKRHSLEKKMHNIIMRKRLKRQSKKLI